MFKNKVLKNASWIIGCKIAQSAMSFVITVLTARYFGPSNYGLINYAAAIVAFVTPMVQLGLGNIQVQEIVNKPDKEGEIIGTTLAMSLASAILGVIGIVSFSLISSKGNSEVIIVCALYSIVLFFQSAELLQYWFQAKYLSKYASLSSLVAFGVITIYKIFLLTTRKGIYFFAISNSIDYIIITFVLLAIYKKLGGQKLKVSFFRAKKLFAKSKYYILANMMIAVFSQTDRIMLKWMINDAATGLYSAAISCACIANFVYTAIIDSFRPMIFESYKVSTEEFEKSMSLLYSVIIYLSLAYCIVVTVGADLIIKIIYGSQYAGAVFPLRIAVWFSTFSFIGSVRNIWILAVGKQRWIWIINLSGALGNVIVNFILIPIIGISGAAVASLLTQIFSNIIVTYIIPDTRPNTYLMIKGLNAFNLIKQFAKRNQKENVK